MTEGWEGLKGKRVEDLMKDIVPARVLEDEGALQLQARYILVKLPRIFWDCFESMAQLMEIPLEDIVSLAAAGNPLLVKSITLRALTEEMESETEDNS